MHRVSRTFTANAKHGIPCTSGGDVIKSAFPQTLAEHREYPWKHPTREFEVSDTSVDSPSFFLKPNNPCKLGQKSHILHAFCSTAREVPYFINVAF